jgi:hypothetical protein
MVVVRGWSTLIPLVMGETLKVPTCMGLVEEGNDDGLVKGIDWR